MAHSGAARHASCELGDAEAFFASPAAQAPQLGCQETNLKSCEQGLARLQFGGVCVKIIPTVDAGFPWLLARLLWVCGIVNCQAVGIVIFFWNEALHLTEQNASLVYKCTIHQSCVVLGVLSQRLVYKAEPHQIPEILRFLLPILLLQFFLFPPFSYSDLKLFLICGFARFGFWSLQ